MPRPLYLSNTEETLVPQKCEVTGQFPDWLAGELYRAGPGTFDVTPTDPSKPVVHIHHWFDGLSLLHKFVVHPNNGGVEYSSRATSSQYKKYIEETGEVERITFGQLSDPCESLFRKVTTFFYTMKHVITNPDSKIEPQEANVCVNIVPDFPGIPEDNIAILTDALPIQLVDKSLNPVKITTYNEITGLKGRGSTAHPSMDDSTKELYNIVSAAGKNGGFAVMEFSPKNPKGVEVASVSAAPAYIHSLFLSENYVIFLHQPYKYSYGGLGILYNRSVVGGAYWDDRDYCVFYVIDRKKKTLLAAYKTDPFFFFHSINAYETTSVVDGQTVTNIICDVIAYDDTSIVDLLNIENMSNKDPHLPYNEVRRYELTNIEKATEQYAATPQITSTANKAVLLHSLKGELPRINPEKNMQDYTYVYMTSNSAQGFFEELVKLNVKTRQAVHWKEAYKNSCFVGEPVFIPNPNNPKSEDDGVVLSVVFSDEKNKSHLVCLDAATFKEIGRAELPKVVPAGFHGAFVPN